MRKVIVISFDSWHAGFFGLYGNPWVDTPELDEFAVGAAVFDRHFAEDLSADSVQHAWWTSRYQFPLKADQQRIEPTWLKELASHGIQSTLLRDPAAQLPLEPQQFSNERAISLDDVVGLHFERETPRFVKLAVQRIRKMEQQPDQAELFWIHAGGLPIDVSSPAYEELYADNAPDHETSPPMGDESDDSNEVESELSEDEGLDDRGDDLDDPEEDSIDEVVASDDFTDEFEAENQGENHEFDQEFLLVKRPKTTDIDEDLISFPPIFWRRARSSPRELADASLRGAGWTATESGTGTEPNRSNEAKVNSPSESVVNWQVRRDQYSGQATQWDAWIGQILKAALHVNETSPAMIIFTAARGEHLGEHAESVNPTLFEETLRVPLIIHVPDSDPFAGRRLQLTTAADVPATILDWFGIQSTDVKQRDGVSLLPVIQQDDALSRDFILTGSQGIRGIRTQDRYFRQDLKSDFSSESIYVKPDDHWDADNMLRQLPDEADELRVLLQTTAQEIVGRSKE